MKCHCVFEHASCLGLGLRERGGHPAIAMIGRPVKVPAVVLIGDGILRLIAADVDVGEGMGHCGGPDHISARADLPLSTAVVWSLCRMAITIDRTCGIARLSFSGNPICACELAFCLSVR